ncbi:DNA-directed RNA polymerases II IV and V subunit 11 [Zea mays]|uniref:DNA-directed RNA polymerases II IV and V subunit 11 n=1 Tax=Zea mays TaxID=4577 RepID=A0A1D6HD73_MAIZE|nr:DNA-directed RNA polymerases II IV and V subunit 11 [Zea mays]
MFSLPGISSLTHSSTRSLLGSTQRASPPRRRPTPRLLMI